MLHIYRIAAESPLFWSSARPRIFFYFRCFAGLGSLYRVVDPCLTHMRARLDAAMSSVALRCGSDCLWFRLIDFSAVQKQSRVSSTLLEVFMSIDFLSVVSTEFIYRAYESGVSGSSYGGDFD